jgi:hypothetical protein
MIEEARCLNLATSAAIVLYEALRQTHFEGLNSAHDTTVKAALKSAELVKGK